jgi:hypothetical protein
MRATYPAHLKNLEKRINKTVVETKLHHPPSQKPALEHYPEPV